MVRPNRARFNARLTGFYWAKGMAENSRKFRGDVRGSGEVRGGRRKSERKGEEKGRQST